MKKYDYVMPPREDDPMNECLDCKYEGKEWGEIDRGVHVCADVVCPKCGSPNYFIKEQGDRDYKDGGFVNATEERKFNEDMEGK
jgi:hypothetical protein